MKTLEKQLAKSSSGIALEKSTVERSVESVTTTSLYDFFPMVIAVLSNLVLIRDSWFILAMRATSFSKHLCSFVWQNFCSAQRNDIAVIECPELHFSRLQGSS